MLRTLAIAIIAALVAVAIEGVSQGAQFDPQDRGCVTHGHKGQSKKGRTPWSTEKLSNGAPAITVKGAI
jgi:hypothetical protein